MINNKQQTLSPLKEQNRQSAFKLIQITLVQFSQTNHVPTANHTHFLAPQQINPLSFIL